MIKNNVVSILTHIKVEDLKKIIPLLSEMLEESFKNVILLNTGREQKMFSFF